MSSDGRESGRAGPEGPGPQRIDARTAAPGASPPGTGPDTGPADTGPDTLADRVLDAVGILLRAVLLVSVAAWAADIAGRLAVAIYTEQYLSWVVGLAMAIVLTDRVRRAPRWVRPASAVLAAVVLGLAGWIALVYPTLQLVLALAPTWAVWVGIALVAGVLEATRRKTGAFLPILVLAMIGFVFVGTALPAGFQTRPVGFDRLMVYLALDTNALLGKVLAIAVIVVIPFIVFGYLLNAFGGSAFFSTVAAALVGRYKGGPAKVSVVGSAAFGMVSGSAVANVVAVGSVSIPMMARAGYRRPVAAAIEAVSSTGGQLMPPIMGASAFLMAELLELPYQSIVVAAIIPAIFFYVALFLAVDFEARRLGVGAAEGEALAGPADRMETLARGLRFVIPVGVLLYLLFVAGRTAEYAGAASVAVLVAVYLAFPLAGGMQRLRHLVRTLLQAMGALTDIVMIAAAAGLIIGVLNVTGISFAITTQMLEVSGGSLALLLGMVAFLSILLGLGMPTVGVYVLLATIAAPALVELAVEPLAAHFYVLYFGMLSMITPPIAIASFAAASVAGTDPWKTAFASIKVGAGVYLIPVAFVLEPELLMLGSPGETALAAARLGVSVVLTTAAAIGHAGRPMGPALRAVALALGVVNILPLGGVLDWASLAAGAALIAFVALPAGAGRRALAADRP